LRVGDSSNLTRLRILLASRAVVSCGDSRPPGAIPGPRPAGTNAKTDGPSCPKRGDGPRPARKPQVKMNDAPSMIPPESNNDEQHLSDASVLAKTGKTWPEWFAILDAAGAEFMDHRQIVAYLSRAHVVSPWWQQMVTVTYEQDRVSRLKSKQRDEFQVSAASVCEASPATLYQAWVDDTLRRQWLPDEILIERSIPGRSLSAVWSEGKTNLEVEFHMRMDGKCQVSVQHRDLASAEVAERLKVGWEEALARLKTLVEQPA
jgi:uncharacterized protein YndB with AHSA1/START domain